MLEELRKEIDGCDKEILSLLKRRMEISEKIAQYKIQNNLQIYDEERERKIIERIKSSANLLLSEKAIENIYREILFESKELQSKLINKKL